MSFFRRVVTFKLIYTLFSVLYKNAFRLKYFLFLLVVLGCVEPYSPPVSKEAVSILVVDGFLSSSSNSATVKLTRAIALSETQTFPKERNASVTIEEQSGSTFSLAETSAGIYEVGSLSLSTSKKYQLHVRTSDGKDYRSDYIQLKQSPPIDSLTWTPDPEGVTVYVSTHDATANTRYYQWLFKETWEYKTEYASQYYLINGEAVPRPEKEGINICYGSENSPKILVTSTLKLSEDRVNKFPLTFLLKGSRKLLRKYSILVEQRAISQEAHDFWVQLQKTTENLGGLFDPMPSQVIGNIHSTNDSSEPVLGYFNGGASVEKRLFIDFYDLPDYLLVFPPSVCATDKIPLDKLKDYPNTTLLIAGYGIVLEGYLTSTVGCIDCRYYGGTTTKPVFWP